MIKTYTYTVNRDCNESSLHSSRRGPFKCLLVSKSYQCYFYAAIVVTMFTSCFLPARRVKSSSTTTTPSCGKALRPESTFSNTISPTALPHPSQVTTPAANMPDSNTTLLSVYEHHAKTHTPLLAALSALTDSISTHPSSTVTELLSLLTTLRHTLTTLVPHHTVLFTHGTAAFERWLITSLGRADISKDAGGETNTIVSMSRHYIENAVTEKLEMAKLAAKMCRGRAGRQREVAVPVWDEVVAEVLAEAVRKGSRPTILLAESVEWACCVDTLEGPVEAEVFYKAMREKYGVFQEGNGAYKLLPPKDFVAAVGNGYAKETRFVLASASLNCANGGVLAPARMGLVAGVAKAAGVKFYIAGEGFRNVGVFPLPSKGGIAEGEEKDELAVKARKEGLEFVVSLCMI
jgi:hypothetical protein